MKQWPDDMEKPLSDEEVAEGMAQLDRIAFAAGALLVVVVVWAAWLGCHG